MNDNVLLNSKKMIKRTWGMVSRDGKNIYNPFAITLQVSVSTSVNLSFMFILGGDKLQGGR